MPGPDDTFRIIVPRFMDAANTNAQNLNAKAMLSRFCNPQAQWRSIFYDLPEASVVNSKQVRLTKLLPRHLWIPHLISFYQQPASAIFYSGLTQYDLLGLRIRTLTGRKLPVIATLEGLATGAHDSRLAEIAGHKVYPQPVSKDVGSRIVELMNVADHIVAISPFLENIARALYGNKVSYLPLGIDASVFHSRGRSRPPRPRVVTTGHVSPHKRPEMFVQAALDNPSADFVWFGGGSQLEHYRQIVRSRGIRNLTFAGAKTPHELAAELRKSSIFAMCSYGEGAPKSLQEAAACGSALLAYGFYRPPSIVPGENGLLAWNDEEFLSNLRLLIADAELAERMGTRGAELAKKWDWDIVAPQWEQAVLDKARALSST